MDDDFWDEEQEMMDYSKAYEIGYYDEKRQELIHFLKSAEYYEKEKPFDMVFGADHC